MHVYELLAEPIRRRIVEILASGSHQSGELEAVVTHEFGVGRSAVQHHLRVMRDHEFVVVRDDWPNRIYELEGANVIRLLKWETKELSFLWRRRIGWNSGYDPLDPKLLTLPRSRRGRRGQRGSPGGRGSRRSRTATAPTG